MRKFKRDNNLDYKPENIVTSTGAKQSLANVILAIVDEGEEVVIPTPYWVTYSELVKIAKGKVVEVKTELKNEFKITPAQLEAAITPKTQAFLFHPPASFRFCLQQRGIGSVGRSIQKHPQVYIISDEIYEYINFVGKHESMAQFADLKDR